MSADHSFYLFVSNLDSISYFPGNSPGHFKVKLEKPLTLDSHWYIALCETQFTLLSSDKTRNINIYSNLTKPSLVNGEYRQILRRVYRTGAHEFKVRQYFPVVQRYIETIEVDIKSGTDSEVSFKDQPVQLTLHLKRVINGHFL